MENQKFLDFVERFFAKAGTVLRKKGRDYPAPEGAPSYVLVDRGRQTYYLLEIASGAAFPTDSKDMRRAIEAYAAEDGSSPLVSGLFLSLGSWLRSPALEEVENALELEGLELQTCLVSSEALRYEIEDYMEEKDIEYQAVPFKDILCIYFFTPAGSEKFASMYESLSFDFDDEDSGQEVQEEEEQTAPEEAVETLPETPEEISPPPTIAEQLEEATSSEIPGADEIKTSIFRERYRKHQAEATKEDGDAFGKNELREIARIKDSIEKEEQYMRTGKSPAAPGKAEAMFYKICRSLWTLIAYTPLAIVNFITKGRPAPSVMLAIACGLVLAGLYYYPLAIGLAPMKEAVLHKVSANTEYLLIFFFSWDKADVFARIAATEGYEPYLRGLSSFTMSIFYFNSGLMTFLNSAYYLRFLCGLGYLMAIAPVWRGFGLRLVSFAVCFYLAYIPMLIAGSMVVRLIAIYADTGIARAQTDSSAALACLHTSFVSAAIIAVAVPLLSAFLAAKASKWRPDFI